MQHILSYFILFIIFISLKFIFKNLKSKFHQKHQKFAGKESIPLLGGIVMFLFYSYHISINDYLIFLFSFLILLVGIFSDNNFLQSPKLRLILQALILLSFINFSDLIILDLRNDILNNLISNYYVSTLFTAFCFLVLINGSNFIDGLDGLNLGYFFLVILTIIYLNHYEIFDVDKKMMMTIFYGISFLLILNILNLLYLGDSGSYLIGLIFGVFLIEINNSNYSISPYFIALLLWYPAFENLFSIIRKRLFKKDPLKPDNFHLHQMIFNFLRNSNNNSVKKYSNIISSGFIIFYNLIIFFISTDYVSHTKSLLFLLACNVIIYITLYFFLRRSI
tara:strand:+ start:2781 stop:3785 length:1005 start_codon:yes stop_codon:yes gene_type:complete